jgi:hypothetical protein
MVKELWRVRSKTRRSSPASGLVTLSILQLMVGEVHQNLGNEKGRCLPTFAVLMNHSSFKEPA